MNELRSELSDKHKQQTTTILSVLPSIYQLTFLTTLFMHPYVLIYSYALYYLALSFPLLLRRLTSLFS